LAIDCPSPTELNFGEDNGVSAEIMHIRKFAEQIKNSRIRFLIICGKNSLKMCE
jgi:tetrahydromethanopterin S-methyltransferase subunit A